MSLSKCGFFSYLGFGCLGTAAGYASVQGIKSYIAPQLTFKASMLTAAAGTIATAFACATGACIGLAITAVWYKEYLLAAELGLTGLGFGIVTSTTLFALANIWNPIGWGLVAIGAVVVVCTLIKKCWCSSTSLLKEEGIEGRIKYLTNKRNELYGSTCYSCVFFKNKKMKNISNQISALDLVRSKEEKINSNLNLLDPKWKKNWEQETVSLINEYITQIDLNNSDKEQLILDNQVFW